MKRGKRTFPSLFTFYSQFAALHRVSRDIPVTTSKAVTLSQSSSGYADTAQAVLPSVSSGQAELVYLDFSSFCSCSLRRSRQRAYCPALAGSGAKSFAYPHLCKV